MRQSTVMRISRRGLTALLGTGFSLATLACSASKGVVGVQHSTELVGDDAGASETSVVTDSAVGLDDVAVESGGSDGGVVGDPVTCDQAKKTHSYVGCDYWPTPVANSIWRIFDFAVVVANAGSTDASVTVTGPGGFTKTDTVRAGGLTKFYLPWNLDLAAPEPDNCTYTKPLTASAESKGGAFHLVSTTPVTVYQFNALEYSKQHADGTPTGPTGKSWASCPGDVACGTFGPVGCFSYSNDASLLLPSTALTGNYRVMGPAGFSAGGVGVHGAYFAITATQDATTVKVQLGSKGAVLAGATVPATSAGGVLSLSMNAGDVVQLTAPAGDTYDLSGSVVNASAPVQVISGIPCENVPEFVRACDHLESTVFPAETLGNDYFVPVTVGPRGDTPGHVVRIFGNVDGTHLTYEGTPPPSAPGLLNAGDVVDLGLVTSNFHVIGDKPFGVGTLMPGAETLDPSTPDNAKEGDPSQSFFAATKQFRKKYVFLAPDDYDISYAEVILPAGTKVTLDGSPITGKTASLGGGYQVQYVLLSAGSGGGAHLLQSDSPVGLQVLGYGHTTSYQYPAGLNLDMISAPPTIR